MLCMCSRTRIPCSGTRRSRIKLAGHDQEPEMSRRRRDHTRQLGNMRSDLDYTYHVHLRSCCVFQTGCEGAGCTGLACFAGHQFIKRSTRNHRALSGRIIPNSIPVCMLSFQNTRNVEVVNGNCTPFSSTGSLPKIAALLTELNWQLYKPIKKEVA